MIIFRKKGILICKENNKDTFYPENVEPVNGETCYPLLKQCSCCYLNNQINPVKRICS